MKKPAVLFLAIIISFSFGFAFKAIILTTPEPSGSLLTPHGRVTGIGGIFFKAKDPKSLREWYHTHLGLEVNAYGSVFEWYQGADSTKKGFLQWSPFKETTKYFEPSAKEFMINYRVDNMEALVATLKQNGVTVTDTISSFDYGKFVHILDLEGNKLELWEPNDVEYEKLGVQMGTKTTK